MRGPGKVRRPWAGFEAGSQGPFEEEWSAEARLSEVGGAKEGGRGRVAGEGTGRRGLGAEEAGQGTGLVGRGGAWGIGGGSGKPR